MSDDQTTEPKTTLYTENPFSYNYVSLNTSKVADLPVPDIDQLVATPLYNELGHLLGIDDVHDWAKYYDKVFTITEWAKQKSGQKDMGKLMKWISSKSRTVPSMGGKNIDNLYLFARLALNK